MACSEETINFNSVTDILFNTFGEVLHRDTIYSIVESCFGDLNHAANAIMSITSEEKPKMRRGQNTSHHNSSSTNSGRAITKKTRSKHKTNSTTRTSSNMETMSRNIHTDKTLFPKMSYAGASTSKKSEKISKLINNSFQTLPRIDVQSNCDNWTEQVRRIVTYHNQGFKTLIIMRGAPGSGKTYLARRIQEMTIGAMPLQVHIYCTDDYFMVNGLYRFDKVKLQSAHRWNQQRASEALTKGVSPVIIDNTNIEYWEIQPYAQSGVENGYILEVVEPNTAWARNLNQLANRNQHGVPPKNIKRMLDMLVIPMTSALLLKNLKLVYPTDMEPPVFRNLPKFVPSPDSPSKEEKTVNTPKQQAAENQDVKKDLEDDKCTPYTTLSNKNGFSKLEICETNNPVNEQIKYSVEKEGECSKTILSMEEPELKCDEIITDNQFDVTLKTTENDIVTDKVEVVAISEDQNVTLDVEVIEKSESKEEANQLPGNQEINDEVVENDINTIQNTGRSSAEYIHDNSTCTKNREDQVDVDKLLEEFQKVENEWDNGEAWEEEINQTKQETVSTQSNANIDAKLPRNKRTKENENSLETLENENDWRKMYVPMPSFTDNNMSPIPSKNLIETKSSETCIEVGDTDTSSAKKGCMIRTAVARDININYLPNLPEKIPENRKFDKSSMTNEITIMTRAHRCKNEDKHFTRFRNMFKHLKKDELRDIFDNCCGDVNWAVSIVMDDMANSQLECITLEEQSEIEEDSDEPCECTSYYGIIPDVTITNVDDELVSNIPHAATVSTESANSIRKPKKDSPLSDSSLALKRQIEQNIVISDQHYSEECLKVRKMRRGVIDGDVNTCTSQNIGTGIVLQNTNHLDTFSLLSGDNSNTNLDNKDKSGPSTSEIVDSEYNSDDESLFNEVEKTVNVNLGHEFLSQLDTLFGRADMGYSENIEPRINMPMSMLNEINALWMESLMCQLEAESKSHEAFVKQDEEFARALYLEQLEVTKSGKIPEVPNFKEIMDMEFALSLYRKDCDLLMQKDRPNDLAAKLSTKKLHDLFPEIPQGDLDEILMAHHYDFQTTVRVLLETQGRTDITQEENGINKFIMAQELERQEKFLAAEKKRLMEQTLAEVPKVVNMDIVHNYRKKAKLHLENWNKNFGKAKHMVSKNTAVANYYNNLAGLHLIKYEQANNIAAATLLKIHSKHCNNGNTIDLHFLHVVEAKAALDMFMDTHIQRHRESYCAERYPALYVVTGRGLHSRGAPKIKPAVIIQLIKRQIYFRELNPGLLSVFITRQDKLSYEMA